jgi:EAL domain-containing protein (putative c-di-GMP-specific phosphodiesterase class I)
LTCKEIDADRSNRFLVVASINSSYLRLEITETMLLHHTEAIIDMLLKIKSRNIQLSIDDFGKGYSSLSYLHRFPINTLKIDSYFISQMNPNAENNVEIVSTINTLAHNLGMDAIAEGVETPQQYAQLKALGCDFGQGYFFAKPLDSLTAEALILSNPQW